jgi:predicted dehydrogenase
VSARRSIDGSVLRWGVLGAGRIAQQFVTELQTTGSGTISGVASRDLSRAEKLAGAAPGAEAFDSYAALLEDARIDAVYIATIHPQHAELIMAAASAGKHILCEKPLTTNGQAAQAACDAAAAAGVALVEAMMYRFQPQTEALRRMLQSGAIGTPLHVSVSCAFAAPFDPGERLFDRGLGGGGILDVGCYSMSFARMVAGWVLQDDAAEPAELHGGGHLAESEVDDWAVASLLFAGGFTAQVRTGTRLGEAQDAVIYGSEGYVYIANPWTPGKDGSAPEFVVSRVGHDEPEVVRCAARPLFGAEAAALAEAVETGAAGSMTPRDSVATMRSLDRWRAAVEAGQSLSTSARVAENRSR